MGDWLRTQVHLTAVQGTPQGNCRAPGRNPAPHPLCWSEALHNRCFKIGLLLCCGLAHILPPRYCNCSAALSKPNTKMPSSSKPRTPKSISFPKAVGKDLTDWVKLTWSRGHRLQVKNSRTGQGLIITHSSFI